MMITNTAKPDRKNIEKTRRNHMKFLQSQLNSLVHHDASSSKGTLTLPDQIDEATKYIKKLQENVADLKRKKERLLALNNSNYSSTSTSTSASTSRSYSLNSPVQIDVHAKGSAIEVILITGLECQFVFTEAIRIVHEEQAEVVNASYSVVGNTVFHSIHAKIRDDATSQEVARIADRLKKFAL